MSNLSKAVCVVIQLQGHIHTLLTAVLLLPGMETHSQVVRTFLRIQQSSTETGWGNNQ